MENAKILNKKKLANLNGENLKFAKKFYWDLTANLKNGREKEEVFSDFLDMLCEAQAEKKKPREIIPDYSEFLNSCIGNLDRSNFFKKTMLCHRKFFVAAVCIILSCVIVFASLFSSGAVGVWSQGIEFMHKSDDYIYSVYALGMDLDFSINLNEINRNEGVAIYQKGGNSVEFGKFACTTTIIFVDAEEESALQTMSYAKSPIIPLWYNENKVQKVTSYNLKITLKTRGNTSRKHAEIISGKPYDHQNQVFVTGSGFGSATLNYSIGSVDYSVADSSNSDANFFSSDTIEFIISANLENEEKLNFLLNTEQLKVTIKGLVLNRWNRR